MAKTSNKDNTVRCKDCKWAHLIQYDQNPILAECLRNPQPGNARFPYKVEVAMILRICILHIFDPTEKEIEHRTHHKKEVTE